MPLAGCRGGAPAQHSTLETGRAGVYNGGMKCIILQAGGREIAVETERKRVRNLNLRVRADGSVHVSAPAYT